MKIRTFLLLTSLLVPVLVIAQPVPRVSNISPDYIQRGTTVDVTVTGDNLVGATGLLFSGEPGIEALVAPARTSAVVESTRGGIGTSGGAPDPRKVNVRVTVT